MSNTLLEGTPTAAADTDPEVTPLGEGRMVREDCWREVHRLFHVEQQSKSEIARQLALDRKTVRGILHEAAWQPYMRAEHGDALDLMRRVKDALDPKGILNPGKIYGSKEPD